MANQKETFYEQHRHVFKEFPYDEVARTAHIESFKTKRFRNLAIEPERSEAFYVWAELHNEELPGISVRNERNPGQPYGKHQARNHHLNKKNAPRLMLGHQVWYLKIDSVEALRLFLDWYAKQS